MKLKVDNLGAGPTADGSASEQVADGPLFNKQHPRRDKHSYCSFFYQKIFFKSWVEIVLSGAWHMANAVSFLHKQ